jgi:predicted Fe-Mo cluster-binding NifX family protein
MKNMEPAPYMGSRFGQDVEPSGTYVLEKDFDRKLDKPWVEGQAEIKKPLFIEVNDDTLISYKYELAKKYKAKGKRLTEKLMAVGYDAIITMRDGESGEIILFPNCSFMLNRLDETKLLIKNLLRESLLPESIKNGEYHVFHGSKTKITKFVDEFVGGKEAIDQEGPGIYFTTSEDEAYGYGENIYSVTLTPRLLFDEAPINTKKLRPLITKLAKMAPDWEESAQNYDENPSRGIIDFVESTLNYNDNEKDCLLQVWIDFYRNSTVDYVRNCVKLGIDGIIVQKEYKNAKHVIVYNPSIINVK